MEISDEDSFFRSLASINAAEQNKSALVYIHGYNTSFEDALRRTAQIAFDLSFKGAPILYSWPAKGGWFGAAAYAGDKEDAKLSVLNLEQFLENLASRSGANSISIIAHSLGNQVLIEALDRFVIQHSTTLPSFDEVVLAAPDVDVGVFNRLSENFGQASRRTTIYVSDRDRVLVASEAYNSYPRVGHVSNIRDVKVVGFDVIDASAVETSLSGHDPLGERSIMSDVKGIILDHLPVASRFGIRKRNLGETEFWAFVP